jgi:hypothetical protein
MSGARSRVARADGNSRDLLGQIAAVAVGVVADGRCDRVGICSAEDCRWVRRQLEGLVLALVLEERVRNRAEQPAVAEVALRRPLTWLARGLLRPAAARD